MRKGKIIYMSNVLDILREQKEMELKGNLYHITQINFAYNTNHIEGSTLTEEQTRYIYETNTLVLGDGNSQAKVDDIIETSNHFKLVDYMLDVANDMNKLLNWYNSLEKVTFEDIVKFHSDFEKIHPFQDGNGRVGRIIMFKECLKNDIVPFIILDKDKLFYYRGLNEYQHGGEKGYLIDTCLNAQDQYQKLIEKFIGDLK